VALIGIDLGTTNSACCIWKDGKTTLIPNATGKLLTPSVVSIDNNGFVLIGQAAKERLVSHPELTTSKFKRFIGTDKKTSLGKFNYSATELSSLILRALKQDAEAYLDCEVKEAVISVPAYFNDIQRKATKLAAELAGIKVERLVNEPTAAALAYGLHESPDDARYLILDLGGGTFDVTILEYFDGVMEVHASSGDNQLGGEDFVELLVNDFCKKHDIEAKRIKASELSTLYHQMEKLKREVSKSETACFSTLIDGQSFSYELNNLQFGQICEPLIKRLSFPIERVLMDARIALNNIDEVVLVGGATRMPVFHQHIAKLLKRFPSFNLDPDEVVTIGAGIQAALKADDKALNDVVLTDVSPYSLGIEIHNEADIDNPYFDPIIERNSILPTSISKTYTNVSHFQRKIRANVYQGESRYAKNNILIGSVDVKIPMSKANTTMVDIRFSYDMNGLLEVDAYVDKTAKRFNAVFEQAAGSLTEEQKKEAFKRLSALKTHPRHEAENKTLMARLERIYEQKLGDEREFIADLIAKFEFIIEKQDKQLIARHRKELCKTLDDAVERDWLL